MKENNGQETIIECICRRYRIKMPGGIVTEVESIKPLSVQMTHELLEEDNEIDSFFSNYKITSLRHVVTPIESYSKNEDIIDKQIFTQRTLTPRQRLNVVLEMKGEFTREDYQKYMLDMHRLKIQKFMAYDDLREAIKAKRLVRVEEKKSGRMQMYKVVDHAEIDEQLYKTIINDHKVHMEIVQ
jgi:hypothetical protein